MASNKRKSRRERELKSKVYTKSFIILFDITNSDYEIFFGLNKKFSKAVKRNKVKKYFRNLVREEVKRLNTVLGEGKKVSICLISKKGLKYEDIKETFRDELEKGFCGVLKILNEKAVLENS